MAISMTLRYIPAKELTTGGWHMTGHSQVAVSSRLLRTSLVAVLAITLIGCSTVLDDDTGSPQPTQVESASSGDQSTEPPTASELPPELPSLVVDEEEFYLPSRNVACHLEHDTAGCVIYEHDFRDPIPLEDCDTDFLPVLSVDNGGYVTYGQCRGDPFAVPAVTLEYGSASQVGVFACVSQTSAVTCWETETRHGFVLARDSYRVF